MSQNTKEKMKVSLIDRVALLNHNPAAPEVIVKAKERVDRALLQLGVGESVLTSWLFSKCYYHLPTTAIDTMAVAASGDGTCFFLFNPDFVVSLATDEDVMFVVFHEGRHLMHRHLWTESDLRSDEAWTLACEANINHVAKTRLGRRGMPEQEYVDENGVTKRRKTGVDPDELYKTYVEDLKKQGIEFVSREKFTETDFGCYSEIKRMAKPPTDKQKFKVCIHQEGDGNPQSGTQNMDGNIPMDQEAVDAAVKQALQNAMTQARQGNEKARAELLEAADRSEDGNDRLSKLWGSYGIMGLRGKTDATRKIEWWKQWLTDTLSSKLRDGYRLIYPKKRAGILLALGQDPMLARRGQERTKVVWVFYDTSGSMPQHVIDWLTKLVGSTDGVEFRWFMFDGTVEAFEPGGVVKGGGGTNFQNCVDLVEGNLKLEGVEVEEEPDAVIMVTDGYAPHVSPIDPDKWIWLITESGDDWPDSHNPQMAAHKVITGDM